MLKLWVRRKIGTAIVLFLLKQHGCPKIIHAKNGGGKQTWRIIMTVKRIAIATRDDMAEVAVATIVDRNMVKHTNATAAGKLVTKGATELVGAMITTAGTARVTTRETNREEDMRVDAISAPGLIAHRMIAIGMKRRHQRPAIRETMAGATVRPVLTIVTGASLNVIIRGPIAHRIMVVDRKSVV